MTICRQNGYLNKKLQNCLPAAAYKAQPVFSWANSKNCMLSEIFFQYVF